MKASGQRARYRAHHLVALLVGMLMGRGYEATASFYGEGLGQLLLDHAKALGLAAAAKH